MGLLDMQQPQAQMPTGGLLGSIGQPLPSMPPELQNAISQMRGAPPEQKQMFVQKVMESIKSSDKPQDMKMQVMQQFMQAMQG